MAISNKFVTYSKTVEVPIYAPKSYDAEKAKWQFSDEVVATFSMVSTKSPDGRAAQKTYVSDLAKFQNEMKKKQDAGKLISGVDLETKDDMLLKVAASCIVSWDWTDEYFEGEGKPDLSVETAVRIFKDADWITQQAGSVPGDFGNFTNP